MPWPLGSGSTRHGVMGWAACRVAVSAIVDAILQFGCIWRIPFALTHLLMYYRGKGNGNFLGRARALTWILESMEDAFWRICLHFLQTHFCSRATHCKNCFGSYRVAYEKHDDTLRVTFIPPLSLLTSCLVPLICSIMTFALATKALAYSFCTTCLSNPQIPLSLMSHPSRMDVNLSRPHSRVFRSTS